MSACKPDSDSPAAPESGDAHAAQADTRECRVCHQMTCPSVAKVAELLRGAVEQGHKFLGLLASEDPSRAGWRSQAAYYDAVTEGTLYSLSRELDGVCMECQPKEFPEDEERFGDPEFANFTAWKRWCFSVPPRQDAALRQLVRDEVLADVEATGAEGARIAAQLRPPPTVTIATTDGPKDKPCAFLRGGIAVVLLGEATLEQARAEVAAGNAEAWPEQAWGVTHVASGTDLVSTFPTAETAIEAARRLLPLADWTLSGEELKKRVGPDGEAARVLRLERMRCQI